MGSQIKLSSPTRGPVITGVASIQGNTGPALDGVLNLIGNTANGWSVAGAGSTLTISKTATSAFSGYQNASVNNVTGNATLYTPCAIAVEMYDVGNEFASNIFTAAQTGYYRINASWYMGQVTASTQAQMYLTTESYTVKALEFQPNNISSSQFYTVCSSVHLPVTAGQTIRMEVRLSGGGLLVDWSAAIAAPRASLSIYKID